MTRDPVAPPPVVAAPPWVLIRDPATLATLQAQGLGLGPIGFGHAATDNAELARDPYYASLIRTLGRDVAAIARSDSHAGVGLRHLHRLFDLRWLESDRAWFDLVGVVNRLDRRGFAAGSCGETRLVYRLSHRAEQAGAMVTSRLPMTVNVVFWQPDDGAGCRTRAAAWREVDVTALRADDGPLAAQHLTLAQLKSIEIDVQTERWPSTIRPDLAGHAGYVLRVFARDEQRGAMVPQPLENTPDVGRMERDAAGRDALLAWLRTPAALAALDQGVLVTPTEFLATQAESVTPRGLARLANRPWSSIYTAAAFSDLDLSTYSTIASPAAVVRRLDGLTCNGCHQSRSVAGFHLLGDELDDPDRVDALAIGTSPHLEAELIRRAAYVTAVADGSPPQEHRPPADVAVAPGGYGSHCGLGDPGFAWMGCTAPLACAQLDDEHVGVCLPVEHGAGAPCEVGLLTSHRQSRRDRVRTATSQSCARDGVCDDNRVGFPGGMCVVACADVGADEGCGGIPRLTAFNDCLSTGRPFADCVRVSARPAGMRACDARRACRDDYICARTEAAQGVCLPPYFLYQLRVDGHPG